MPLKALIFDFDGLILDTETPDLAAWQEIFAEHGAELDHGFWCQFVGRHGGMPDVVAHLEQQVGRMLDGESILMRRRARCMEMIHALSPRPGVERWLIDARARSLQCAVASSSSLLWVDGHLERLGLRQHFSGVRCRDHVARTKPDPDVYLAALDHLGVAPSEAIAIEDSPHGVTAAKAAGIFCLAVPNEVTRPLDFRHADMIADSLEHVSLTDITSARGESTRTL
ncbi:MAG: HAD family hydrolase [Chloroflexota bacterium]